MNNILISAFADEAASDFSEQLQALQKNGLSLIEIRGVDGKGILDLNDAELSRVVERLSEYGIGVSSIGSPIGKISITEDFEPHFAQFRRAVEIAKRLGTVRIRMFSFYIPQGENPEDYFDEVVRRVSAMVEYGEENGVHCCHENEKGIYGDILPRVIKLHEAVPALRCVYDPANYIQSGDNAWANYTALKGRIDYMHVKDAVKADGSVVPAGCGDGALPEIVADFCENREMALLTVEPHLHVFDGLQNLQSEGIKHKYTYKTAEEAFDAAVNALKALL